MKISGAIKILNKNGTISKETQTANNSTSTPDRLS